MKPLHIIRENATIWVIKIFNNASVIVYPQNIFIE